MHNLNDLDSISTSHNIPNATIVSNASQLDFQFKPNDNIGDDVEEIPSLVDSHYHTVQSFYDINAKNKLNIFHSNVNALNLSLKIYINFYLTVLHLLISLQSQKHLSKMMDLFPTFPLPVMTYFLRQQTKLKVVHSFLLIVFTNLLQDMTSELNLISSRVLGLRSLTKQIKTLFVVVSTDILDKI